MYTIVILIFVTGFLNLRKKRKNSSKNLETRERNNNFNIQSIIVRNKKKRKTRSKRTSSSVRKRTDRRMRGNRRIFRGEGKLDLSYRVLASVKPSTSKKTSHSPSKEISRSEIPSLLYNVITTFVSFKGGD